MPAVDRAPHTVLPPTDLEAMLDLSTFLDHQTEPAALVGPDGQTVPLPLEAFTVLKEVADAMRQGRGITVAPVDQALTTQEAADFLGISRPTLVKLLEAGQIPFERPAGGRHRRVRLADVVAYQEAQRTQRRTLLDEMGGEAAAAGLYDASAENYAEALADARRSRTTGLHEA
ncbi:transcriptional regulator, AlpA family [Kytococcus aerolatus]|uniref:Transcriptional regulator, AlpA family n=1 Tax=Kytococcus aerolatus TaxID=592308 RepID=A0A212TET9_9MICO|nr:helix-turn-helix domain-containing protein [Kytococcus aerolatus]SNC64567.1 transcriptional regulator, AlpA family [Kytococcus aerolatus]